MESKEKGVIAIIVGAILFVTLVLLIPYGVSNEFYFYPFSFDDSLYAYDPSWMYIIWKYLFLIIPILIITYGISLIKDESKLRRNLKTTIKIFMLSWFVLLCLILFVWYLRNRY